MPGDGSQGFLASDYILGLLSRGGGTEQPGSFDLSDHSLCFRARDGAASQGHIGARRLSPGAGEVGVLTRPTVPDRIMHKRPTDNCATASNVISSMRA